MGKYHEFEFDRLLIDHIGENAAKISANLRMRF